MALLNQYEYITLLEIRHQAFHLLFRTGIVSKVELAVEGHIQSMDMTRD